MKFESGIWIVVFLLLVVRCEGVETGKAVGEMVKSYREAVE